MGCPQREDGVKTLMMHGPSHPGEILKCDYIEPLELSVTQAAEALGVNRKTLSAILNERQGVSPAMAFRLARAFDTSPELWVNMQAQFDVWQARHTDVSGVQKMAR